MEIFQNTLEQQLITSKRCAEEQMTDKYNTLVDRRDKLEDAILEARRALDDAETHALEEEDRCRKRIEVRQREETIRVAREQQLRQDAQRARDAAAVLRRQHEFEEAAITKAFASARVRGGAQILGGTGDLRMCYRCRAGPIENIACSNLKTHNNTSRDYKGAKVVSVNDPNACPHCGWFAGMAFMDHISQSIDCMYQTIV